MTAIRDLTAGSQVRHAASGSIGTVHVDHGCPWLEWNSGPLAGEPVGRAWPVCPEDLEILRPGGEGP